MSLESIDGCRDDDDDDVVVADDADVESVPNNLVPVTAMAVALRWDTDAAVFVVVVVFAAVVVSSCASSPTKNSWVDNRLPYMNDYFQDQQQQQQQDQQWSGVEMLQWVKSALLRQGRPHRPIYGCYCYCYCCS